MAFRRAGVPKVPAEWVKRLSEAERREQDLHADLEQLRNELDGLRRELEDGRRGTAADLERQSAHTAAQIEALGHRTRDEHRQQAETTDAVRRGAAADLEARFGYASSQIQDLDHRTSEELRQHAAGIDAIGRGQHGLEERIAAGESERSAQVARIEQALHDEAVRIDSTRAEHAAQHGAMVQRLDELTAGLTAAIVRIDAELNALADATRADRAAWGVTTAGLEVRTSGLEAATETGGHRLDHLEEFRAEAAHTLERQGAELNATVVTLGLAGTRLAAVEASTTAHDGAVAELRTAAEQAGRQLDEATDRLTELDTRTAQSAGRLASIDERLGPINEALSTVGRLDESVTEMGERLTAAELLLNQRHDLELQLDRAEEFERLVAEIDPDRYASREDLNELRRLFQEFGGDNHNA